VATSLAGFVVFYTALAVVDVVLMRKYILKGPDGLGMWRQAPAPGSGSVATAG
jgi:cytochrome d ubiquinol oxidase subunit I